MNNKFGNKLRILRKKEKLTQPELAINLCVSKGIISFWENNINEPKASYIKTMAEFFNVSADYLIGVTNINKQQIIKKTEINKIYDKLNRPHKNMLIGIAEDMLRAEGTDPEQISESKITEIEYLN